MKLFTVNHENKQVGATGASVVCSPIVVTESITPTAAARAFGSICRVSWSYLRWL